MIFILHGNNYPKSRDLIIQIVTKLTDKEASKTKLYKKEISINETDLAELSELTNSFDLFSDPPLIILDISTMGRKNVSEYIEVLEKAPKETNVIILANKELPKTNAFIKATQKLKAKIILNNVIPNSNIFKFIDNLFSKNRNNTYKELTKLIKNDEDLFYIYSMVLYGIRNISYIKYNSPSASKIPSFKKTTITQQANLFTENEIKELYSYMYYLDISVKTGKIIPQLMIPLAIEKVLL